MNSFSYHPIAIARTPFKEKFGVPRQAGMIKKMLGYLDIMPPYAHLRYFEDLVQYERIWILFHFHLNEAISNQRPMVRPPRLGGNEKCSTFCTRSPFRPNPIGMSCVELLKIEKLKKKVFLVLESPDLVDGTPILDIRPYIPEYDSFSDAKISNVFQHQNENEQMLNVHFSEKALIQINNHQQENLKEVIVQILQLNPRPRYQKDSRIYGMKLYDFDLKFCFTDDQIEVLELKGLSS